MNRNWLIAAAAAVVGSAPAWSQGGPGTEARKRIESVLTEEQENQLRGVR